MEYLPMNRTTNAIFNKLCIALALRSDQRLALLRAAGLDVSKSKAHSWSVGPGNRNWEPMPDEALDAVLRHIERTRPDALLAWIGQQLAGSEYQRDRLILPALDRIIELYRGGEIG